VRVENDASGKKRKKKKRKDSSLRSGPDAAEFHRRLSCPHFSHYPWSLSVSQPRLRMEVLDRKKRKKNSLIWRGGAAGVRERYSFLFG